jgi:hypothetical protein
MHAYTNEWMNVWIIYCVCVCLWAYVINLNFYQDGRLPLENLIILIQDREYIACVVDILLKIEKLLYR